MSETRPLHHFPFCPHTKMVLRCRQVVDRWGAIAADPKRVSRLKRLRKTLLLTGCSSGQCKISIQYNTIQYNTIVFRNQIRLAARRTDMTRTPGTRDHPSQCTQSIEGSQDLCNTLVVDSSVPCANTLLLTGCSGGQRCAIRDPIKVVDQRQSR